ncbi:hypothetical protein GSI_02903 [Ganoderma sinense ZZ0214-1]|uniref:GH18 domain-containing protein n=1 Tax=Ganoderma sinense ZZ0214-1 TaxID=1077348 RepID=A0A2G8SMX0_9APHY|nr:hypothetical protein GSI_02903 [Ganoderma sinense ZZ0214-1]
MALTSSFTRVLFIAAVALAAVADVEASKTRPAHHKISTNLSKAGEEAEVVSKRASSGKINGAYYPNWAIDTLKPADIKAASLTHLFYAFADISTDSSTIKLSNPSADEQQKFSGDTNESGTNLYGALKQLYLIKIAHRNIKTVLSVGGASRSGQGHFNFVTSSSKRAAFVKSAVQMVEDYGLDGIDVDYEFPETTAQGEGLASLVTELRTAFDNLQKQKGDATPYLVTAATSAVEHQYEYLDFKKMDAALNFWNLMAYDYTGSWTSIADDQANLYGGSRTGKSTDKAIKAYTSRGVTASKINLGLPAYGNVFEKTDGLGKSYSGTGGEDGVYPYKDLPKAGATVHEDTTDVASYSYDASKRELVSYDTPKIAKLKAQYVQSKGLAGAFFWDLSNDKRDSNSLVDTTASTFGSLDQTQNHINYPSSKFANIRSNMGKGSGGGGSTGKTTSSHTSTTSKASATTSKGSKPTSGSGKCSGVAAWNASTNYKPKASVTYNGHLWTANDYSHNDMPGNYAGIWTDKGSC